MVGRHPYEVEAGVRFSSGPPAPRLVRRYETMVTREEVLEALKRVIDPEIGANIVDLGFVYGVEVSDDDVTVRMTLTAPGCPLRMLFLKQVEAVVKELGARNVNIELVFDPPWSPEMMSEELRKRFGFE